MCSYPMKKSHKNSWFDIKTLKEITEINLQVYVILQIMDIRGLFLVELVYTGEYAYGQF